MATKKVALAACVKACASKREVKREKAVAAKSNKAIEPEIVEDDPEEDCMRMIARGTGSVQLNAEDFPAEKIPAAVAKCFKGMREMKKEVDRAINLARKAKDAADTASRTKSTRWLFLTNKVAIEDVQAAVEEIGGAVEDQSKLMKKLAEYQENIAKATSYLFGLGVLGMAQNHMVVNRIKRELEKASKQELDALARAELQKCLNDLKAREDMQIRVEKNAAGIEQNRQLGLQRDKQIQENRERGFERDKKIERLNRQMRVVAGKRHIGFYLFGVLSVLAFLMAAAVFVKAFFFN